MDPESNRTFDSSEDDQSKGTTVTAKSESIFVESYAESGGEIIKGGTNNKSIVIVSSSKRDEEFLSLVKKFSHKNLKDTMEAPSEPKLMLVDMEFKFDNSKSSGTSDLKSLFGHDVEKIRLEQVHDDHKNKRVHHVMIMGDAGSGKSTLSKQYAKKVFQKEIPSLDHIEIVVFVNAYELQTSSKTTAFDLFFTKRMDHDPETKLSPKLERVGQEWMDNNSSKVLIVVDGLDQSSISFNKKRYPLLSSTAKANTDEILANILANRIWPEALVLTTTRWRVYWDLLPQYRPMKVVAMRGFDNENLVKAVHYYSPNDGESLVSSLENSAPQAISLCRNPLYLSYTAKIFKRHGNLPDTVSELMASVFSYFVHSVHANTPHLKDVTKLAFHGMMDNRFQFTIPYLKKHGIDPKNVEKLLFTGAILEEDQSIVVPEDKKYVFSHQCMQEFAAALHIINFAPQEVQRLIFEKLNEAALESMRKLYYGMILNRRTFTLIENFLQDRSCSVETCQELLMTQLKFMLSNGVISSMKLVNLINECGSESMQERRESIRTIDLKEVITLKNDQNMLASMIDQLPVLNTVHVLGIMSDVPFLDLLRHRCKGMTSFKLTHFIMTDSGLSQEGFHTLPSSLKSIGCQFLGLNNCGLSQEKMSKIGQGSRECGWKIEILKVTDTSMTEPVYHQLAVMIDQSDCSALILGNCKLNETKLSSLAKGFPGHRSKIQRFQITDITMDELAYYQLTVVMAQSKCSILILEECQLNVAKLSSLSKGFLDHPIRIQELKITDSSMNELGYHQLAATISNRCFFVILDNCKLTEAKLRSLAKGSYENKTRAPCIRIMDTDMDESAYYQLAETVGQMKCENFILDECQLGLAKLIRLGEGFREHHQSIQRLVILDISLNKPGYYQLAQTVEQAKCATLVLQFCQLNEEKLSSLTDGFLNGNFELSLLFLMDENLTPTVGMIQLVHRLMQSVVKEIAFRGWLFNAQQIDELKDTLNSASSKATLLQIEGIKYRVAANFPIRILTATQSRVESKPKAKKEEENKKLQEFIFSQVESMLKTGTISSEKLLNLMNLCDNDSMQKYMECIQRIDITDSEIPHGDQMKLGSAIVQCAALEKVYVKKLTNLPFLKLLHEFCSNIESLEVLEFVITDSSLRPKEFHEVPSSLKLTECQHLSLVQCHLSKEKLSQLGIGCEETGFIIQNLLIDDHCMDDASYEELAQTIEKSKCPILTLRNCQVDESKCSCLTEGLVIHHVQLHKIILDDPNFVPTDGVVSEVCKLMQSVVKEIEILGWRFKSHQTEQLKEILDDSASKVSVLKIEDKLYEYEEVFLPAVLTSSTTDSQLMTEDLEHELSINEANESRDTVPKRSRRELFVAFVCFLLFVFLVLYLNYDISLEMIFQILLTLIITMSFLYRLTC